MPRPRPTVDQRQHIIRCDDALWAKISAAAAKRGLPINAYLNFTLTVAMEKPTGPSQTKAASAASPAKPAAPKAKKRAPTKAAVTRPAPSPFSKEAQTRRSPRGSGAKRAATT